MKDSAYWFSGNRQQRTHGVRYQFQELTKLAQTRMNQNNNKGLTKMHKKTFNEIYNYYEYCYNNHGSVDTFSFFSQGTVGI